MQDILIAIKNRQFQYNQRRKAAKQSGNLLRQNEMRIKAEAMGEIISILKNKMDYKGGKQK